jgi:hypothetical protein
MFPHTVLGVWGLFQLKPLSYLCFLKGPRYFKLSKAIFKPISMKALGNFKNQNHAKITLQAKPFPTSPNMWG